MSAAIELRSLSKHFTVRAPADPSAGPLRRWFARGRRTLVAVDGICLRIAAGERVAFVGPNGAGKSTTIKMLAGVLLPTAGELRVCGLQPWQQRRALAYRIGTVFGQRSQLWQHLPPADTFALLGAIYGVARAEHRRRQALLVEAFELGGLLQRPVRQLSLGQRMRCEIVASLLHAPRVLFLDEPTIGLDASARATIRDVVRELAASEGCTVLLTSHDTGDMERVCDRVVVIHGGRILVDEPLEQLRRGVIRRKRVTLTSAARQLQLELPGVSERRRAAHVLELEVDTSRTPIDAVVRAAMAQGHLADLTVEDPPMDEIVAALYERAVTPRATECAS
ncbi:MAG: ATP-binding cassette domain-containing protein [Nannocystaceae bacterium]|nr:ATP-binding cassette domain-containing protein [Nannocystaceae bacterium]